MRSLNGGLSVETRPRHGHRIRLPRDSSRRDVKNLPNDVPHRLHWLHHTRGRAVFPIKCCGGVYDNLESKAGELALFLAGSKSRATFDEGAETRLFKKEDVGKVWGMFQSLYMPLFPGRPL